MAGTEGQRLLRQYLRGRKQCDLARAIGRTGACVSVWVSGGSIPSTENAVTLKRLVGIPVEAWTQRINGKRKAS